MIILSYEKKILTEEDIAIYEVSKMKVIAIDPEPAELLRLTDSIRKIHSNVSIESFGDPLTAVKFVYGNRVDEIYSVLEMKRMDGFQVARLLLSKYPGIRFRFIVDRPAECTEALCAIAAGFVFRPVSKESLLQAQGDLTPARHERANKG